MGSKGKSKKTGNYQTVRRVLPCELTDGEMQSRGVELADLESQAQATREESAADAARWREKKKALAKSITDVSQQINERSEQREIVCDMVPDYKRNVMEVVRQDNGDVVEERALTPDERQLELGAGAPGRGRRKESVVQDVQPGLAEDNAPLEPDNVFAMPAAEKPKRERRPHGVGQAAE